MAQGPHLALPGRLPGGDPEGGCGGGPADSFGSGLPELTEQAGAWFAKFVADYGDRAEPGSERAANVTLKREHSYRVWDLARRIAAAHQLPSEEAELAELAALLHDVGRFEQYERYNTFRDAQSVNHAWLGCRILRREWVASVPDLDSLRLARLLGAVACHNRRRVPLAMEPGAADLCRLVRDADKLDIIAVMLVHFVPEASQNTVVTLGVEDLPGVWTPAIVADIRAGRIGSYAQLRTLDDFKLILLSWVFDLNYAHALHIFAERDYAGSLLALLPDDPSIREAGERVRDYLMQGCGPQAR